MKRVGHQSIFDDTEVQSVEQLTSPAQPGAGFVLSILPTGEQLIKAKAALENEPSEFFDPQRLDELALVYAFGRDQQLLGVMSLVIQSPFASNAMEIGAIHVMPSYRRAGVGSSLLESAFVLASSCGKDLILGQPTADGEQHLDHVSDRLWKKYPSIDLMT